MADLVSLSPEDLLAEVRLLSGPTSEPLLELRAVRDRLRNLALDVGNGTSRIDAEALRAEWSRAIHDAVSQGVKEVVRGVEMDAQLAAGAQREWMWTWIAVGDEGTCAPCDANHGREQSLDDWQREGEPGTPRGQCSGGMRCRCSLIPIRPEGA